MEYVKRFRIEYESIERLAVERSVSYIKAQLMESADKRIDFAKDGECVKVMYHSVAFPELGYFKADVHSAYLKDNEVYLDCELSREYPLMCCNNGEIIDIALFIYNNLKK